jgi:alpha-beta hydrolase superfamily lysophospholipase
MDERLMKVLYLHGLHSRPGGVKPTFLRGQGYDLDNPAHPDEDFAASVRAAQAAFDANPPDVVVGSSRGGAVAMSLDSRSTPLVLIAPAWKKWGDAAHIKPGTIILHSANDEVIPIADSHALIAASGLPKSALVVVGADHKMVDEPALRALIDAIEQAARGSRRGVQ